jgi:type II secretory pathway pseudopilin PulG
VTIALAIIAVLISLAALVVAMRTASFNRRSAEAAEGSQHAADRSADAAKQSAESAALVAQVELGRNHRDLAPQREWVRMIKVQNPRTGRDNIFLAVTPARTYLTHCDLLFNSGGRTPVSPVRSNVIPGGVEDRLYVGELVGAKLPDEVEIRFFPPPEGSQGEPWTCACGEPLIGDHNERGHWVMRLKVSQAAVRAAAYDR